MIKRLKIIDLFERFNYDIDLNKELIILTGPNGYGKSTILKIILAINKGNFEYFRRLTFKKIEIEFNNYEGKITLEKDYSRSDTNLKINGVEFKEYINIINKIRPTKYMNIGITDEIDGIIDFQDIDYARKFFKSKIYHDRIKYIGEEEEKNLLVDYINLLSRSKKSLTKAKAKEKIKLKDAIETLENTKEEIYFIKEQRMFKNIDNEKVVELIEDIPKRIKERINEISQIYSKKANMIDSTYPLRLFNTLQGITEEEYDTKLEEIMEKFEKLNDYDISDINIIDTNVKFKEEHSKALKVYFDDFDDKYKVYEEDINKFDSFKKIINNKLSFKEIKISKGTGLSVLNHNGNEIKLSMLSSGEKQQIVLYYNLIFELEDKTVLMIDEPEISLHIIWQQDFMDDLLKVIKDKNIKVIVATHSPQILSSYWDNQIDLGELYGE